MLVRQPARGSVGAPSEDAAQIVTLDVHSGQRTQLTRLPGPADPLRYVTYNPRFTGNHTVLFQTISNPDGQHPERFPYRVQTDGSGLGALPTPFALPGAAPIPDFTVIGGRPHLVGLALPGEPVNGEPPYLLFTPGVPYFAYSDR